MHAVNTIHTPLAEVPDEKFSLIFHVIRYLWCIVGCFWFPLLMIISHGLHSMYVIDILYEGVVVHMQVHDAPSDHVIKPYT